MQPPLYSDPAQHSTARRPGTCADLLTTGGAFFIVAHMIGLYKVVRHKDGDTSVLRPLWRPLASNVTIRLLGVDARDKTPAAEAATAWIRRRAPKGHIVAVRIDKKPDKFGRTLGDMREVRNIRDRLFYKRRFRRMPSYAAMMIFASTMTELNGGKPFARSYIKSRAHTWPEDYGS